MGLFLDESQADGFAGIMAEINPAEVKTIPTGFLLQRPLEVGSELFRSLKQEMSSAFAAGFKKAKTFIEQKDLAELFQKMPTESPLIVRLVFTSTQVLQKMLEGNLDKGVFVEKLKKIVIEELNERFSQDLSLQDISFNETNLGKAVEESFDHHDVPKFTMTLSEGKYQIFCNSFQICEVKANILEQYQAWRTARLELDNQDFLKLILGEMENLNEGSPFDQFFRIINGLSGKSSS